MKTKSSNNSLLGLLVAVVLIGLALAWLRNTPTATPQSAQPTQPILSNTTIAVAANAPALPNATRSLATQQQPSRTPASSATTRIAKATPRPPTKPPASNTVDGWVVRNVKIYDLDNNLVYKGDVDIEPTLDRIAKGISDSHRNDGSTFGNFERRLPSKPRGYYTEYVLRTPGLSGVGPQRVILGRNDEVYYTPDHYITFVRVK